MQSLQPGQGVGLQPDMRHEGPAPLLQMGQQAPDALDSRRSRCRAELLIDEVIDREEWDAMDEDERADEDINDILSVDKKAAHQYLAAGRSLLR